MIHRQQIVGWTAGMSAAGFALLSVNMPTTQWLPCLLCQEPALPGCERTRWPCDHTNNSTYFILSVLSVLQRTSSPEISVLIYRANTWRAKAHVCLDSVNLWLIMCSSLIECSFWEGVCRLCEVSRWEKDRWVTKLLLVFQPGGLCHRPHCRSHSSPVTSLFHSTVHKGHQSPCRFHFQEEQSSSLAKVQGSQMRWGTEFNRGESSRGLNECLSWL